MAQKIDITIITPVFDKGKIVFFVASRAHHADIGGLTAGKLKRTHDQRRHSLIHGKNRFDATLLQRGNSNVIIIAKVIFVNVDIL